MEREERIAYIHSQTAAMLAELEGMKIANAERANQSHAPAYDERAFMDLPTNFGLTHNQVISFLMEY
jgi:hypothetical protein